jgi:hypothetical protein
VPGIRASDVEIEATEAQCDRTNTGFECYPVLGANRPQIKIFNYAKGAKLLVGCSAVLDNIGGETGANSHTKFLLPTVTTPFADIVIKEGSCL